MKKIGIYSVYKFLFYFFNRINFSTDFTIDRNKNNKTKEKTISYIRTDIQ